MGLIAALYLVLRAAVVSRDALGAENLALQHQLLILHRSVKRPTLRPFDRLFWGWLSRFWSNWRSACKLFQPDTVVKWHKLGFKLYWRWLSKPCNGGRPSIDQNLRNLIRRMARERSEQRLPFLPPPSTHPTKCPSVNRVLRRQPLSKA